MEKWIVVNIKTLKEKFEGVTAESRDELGLLGMHTQMDCEWMQVVIMHPKYVEWIIETLKVTKQLQSPALVKLMADDADAFLLEDQPDNISKCAMLVFLSQKTPWNLSCSLQALF